MVAGPIPVAVLLTINLKQRPRRRNPSGYFTGETYETGMYETV